MVVEGEDAVVAAGPDDVGVLRVGHRETNLAAADLTPGTDRYAATSERIARPHGGRAVLAVAVDVIGNPVVGRHVVDLRHRKLRPQPGLAPVDRDAEAAVVAGDAPVAIERIDPDVVVVPARVLALDRQPAVVGDGLLDRHEGDLVGVVRRRRSTRVVERSLGQVVVGIDHPPAAATIVRAPEHALEVFELGKVLVRTGLDQGVDPVRVGGRHGEPDLAPGRLGQPVALELAPGPPRRRARCRGRCRARHSHGPRSRS